MKTRYEELLYNRGYRISNDGIITNPKGKTIKSVKTDNKGRRIPKISFRLEDGTKKDIRAARLQAYQKFGNELYEDGKVVIVNNDDITDISYDNISLGINGQNLKNVRPNKNVPKYDKFTVIKYYNKQANKEYKKVCSKFKMSKSTLHNILDYKGKSYRCLGEFKSKQSELYYDAKQQGHLEELCEETGWEDELEPYWTKKRCIILAKFHKSRTRWKSAHPLSYRVADKKGWLDDIQEVYLKPFAEARYESMRTKKDDPNYDYDKFLEYVDIFKSHFENIHQYKSFVGQNNNNNPLVKQYLPPNPKETFPSKGKTNNEVFNGKLRINDIMTSTKSECETFAINNNLYKEEDWVRFIKENGTTSEDGFSLPENPYEHFGLKLLNEHLMSQIKGGIKRIGYITILDNDDRLYGIEDMGGKIWFRYTNSEYNDSSYNKEPFFSAKSYSKPFRLTMSARVEELEFINEFSNENIFNLDSDFVKNSKTFILTEKYTPSWSRTMTLKMDSEYRLWFHHTKHNNKYEILDMDKYIFEPDEEIALHSFIVKCEKLKTYLETIEYRTINLSK